MKTTEKILVVDLEATCWNSERPPLGQESEIIEIGICELHVATGTITNKQGILVIPERSTVSRFCTELTTITPELIAEEGVIFEDAVDILFNEYHAPDYTWASFGAYDKNQMLRQCTQRRVDYPFATQHLNVKELFKRAAGLHKSVGMASALTALHLPMEGTHHRGVDDAYNTAKILHWCLNNL